MTQPPCPEQLRMLGVAVQQSWQAKQTPPRSILA